MKKIDYLIAFILFLTGLLTRLNFVEKIFSQWDGPLYAIGVIRYSFEQTTPTFPGYPFYIALGKFFYLFLHDPQRSILAVSIFGSAAGAVVIYLIGWKMFHKLAGIAGAVIFLTGSTFYYFSLTTYAYILTPITTTILAFVVYRIFVKRNQEGLFLGTALGISVGTRPQEAPQIILLFILGFLFLKSSEKIKSIFSFSIVTLLWFIPVINAVGLHEYFKLFIGLKQYNLHAPIIQNIDLITKGFLLSFGLSSFFLFYYIYKFRKIWKKQINKNLKIIVFFAVWIVPGFLINLLLRSDHAGYQMTYISGFLLVISYAIWKATQKNKLLYLIIVVTIAVFNLYWFFYDRDPNFVKPYRPTSFHYSDIRKNDLKTGSKIHFIENNFDSKKTVVIALPVLWMPYAYYLKYYQVTSLGALDIKNEKSTNLEQDVKNWHITKQIKSDLTFSIPHGITSIVFPDDNAYSWIKNYPYKIYHLPGNSTITSISVSENNKIKYSYQSLEIK
jgi:hypothetical protein